MPKRDPRQVAQWQRVFLSLFSQLRPTGDRVHDVVYGKLLLTKHSLGREPRSIETRLTKVLIRKEDEKKLRRKNKLHAGLAVMADGGCYARRLLVIAFVWKAEGPAIHVSIAIDVNAVRYAAKKEKSAALNGIYFVLS